MSFFLASELGHKKRKRFRTTALKAVGTAWVCWIGPDQRILVQGPVRLTEEKFVSYHELCSYFLVTLTYCLLVNIVSELRI